MYSYEIPVLNSDMKTVRISTFGRIDTKGHYAVVVSVPVPQLEKEVVVPADTRRIYFIVRGKPGRYSLEFEHAGRRKKARVILNGLPGEYMVVHDIQMSGDVDIVTISDGKKEFRLKFIRSDNFKITAHENASKTTNRIVMEERDRKELIRILKKYGILIMVVVTFFLIFRRR